MPDSPLHPEFAREYRYLLGLLDETERENMQVSILEDEAAFDRVREAENDLFDAYARGALAESYRLPFERKLLASDAGRGKLAAAKALARRARPAHWRWIAVAAGLFVAAGSSALWMRWNADPAAPTAVPASPRRLTIDLPPGGTRAADSAMRFALPPAGVDGVDLRIPRPAGSETEYELELRTSRGERRWQSGPLIPAPDTRVLVAAVPASALGAGSYELMVSSRGSPLAYHDFRVE